MTAAHTVRVAGHFGEWLQGRLGPQGPVVLITLPCAALGVRAEALGPGDFSLEQYPPALLPEARAAAFLRALGGPVSGRYRLEAEMPPGGGAGASTAALLALAGAAGHPCDAALAGPCVATEGASDPLMLPRPDAVLWAPREGHALGALPTPPRCEILGGFWGPPLRTAPQDAAFPDVADLIDAWRGSGDLAEFAALASQSAARTTALRGPEDDPTPALCAALGALGHLRAHTGSARGLIFPPGAVPEGAEARLAEAGFEGVLRFETGAA
ncbi:propanediol utilization protein [Poseidonocella sedimentorum]|uniref:propanediol utilization protein n=1 Tax=Poseidonocella sedimentorum TaxID=871652 RepID=UPI001FE7CDFD|nr:propanediol utilization protein [Poseidonocella sedimentorum]